jgi:hypothetical protein
MAPFEVLITCQTCKMRNVILLDDDLNSQFSLGCEGEYCGPP